MKVGKPKKPYADYPLFPHASGQWAKKIKGRFHYFGVWDDPQAALENYQEQRDYLYCGQLPPAPTRTVADILNSFLRTKQAALELGNLTSRSFNDYVAVCDTIADTLIKRRPVEGITNDDLYHLRTVLGKGKAGKPISPVSHKRLLTQARSVFLHANEELGCAIRYKKPLQSPSAKALRQARNDVGERLFTGNDILALLEIAKPQMRAMIYLGINCGFGNSDCATLPIEHVKLKDGWHTYWRPKTEIARRCPLWPETAAALYAVIKDRNEGPVFVTKYGNPWTGNGRGCPVSCEFRKLVTKMKMHRPGVTTFYTLRRTFETIAASTGDQVAVDFIMGHAPDSNDMAAVYRQKTFNSQLLKVTDHVHSWLHGSITIR